MKKMFTVFELFRYAKENSIVFFPVFPETHNDIYDFWVNTYTEDLRNEYDREFARRYRNFLYFDFMEAPGELSALSNFQADIKSIFTQNQKRYNELYRVYVIENSDMPITYNYDMLETTGKQKTTFDKGSQENTYGQRIDTIGAIDNTHKVAPFNTTSPQTDSQDITAQRQDTTGQHTDTDGSRRDTTESDAWTLTRRGNIGTQTASDIAEKFQNWAENYKFMELIFEDICKQLLLIGDDRDELYVYPIY